MKEDRWREQFKECDLREQEIFPDAEEIIPESALQGFAIEGIETEKGMELVDRLTNWKTSTLRRELLSQPFQGFAKRARVHFQQAGRFGLVAAGL